MIKNKVNQIIPCVECLKKEKEIERLNALVNVYKKIDKHRIEMSENTDLLLVEVKRLIKIVQ